MENATKSKKKNYTIMKTMDIWGSLGEKKDGI